MRMFKSLIDYATDDVIIRLLAKERGKYVSKKTGKPQHQSQDDPDIWGQLQAIMPPRSIWRNPGKRRRPTSGNNLRGIALWTRKKRLGASRVYVTILRELERGSQDSWAIELRKFIDRIHGYLDGSINLKFESPTIIAKFKEQDPDTGHFIYRPICKYTNLETKILLALSYNYLLYCFDDCFHRNMLFMRSARRTNQGWKTPNYLDAIRMTDQYRERNDNKLIFVGECDIQKFYDIFNHDDILACFEELFKIKKKRQKKLKKKDFDPIRRIVRAYLESYDYANKVMVLNDTPSFWAAEKRIHATPDNPDPVCRFKWVSEKSFVESRCYKSKEEFIQARDEGKIGIPQGGALSGIIVNVVMNVIDKGIVEPNDPDCLFVRYCDDILLMHTDRRKCEQYLDYYVKALTAHKLVPHNLVHVSEMKNGFKTASGFWHAKSKHVFLWGHGMNDSSDWVGFVGLEMRRTGEIRVRKDKVNSEAKRIAKTYYSVIKSNTPEERINSFNSLAGHFKDYELISYNRYTVAQAKRLDNYLKLKVKQACKKRGVDEPAELKTYCDTLIDMAYE